MDHQAHERPQREAREEFPGHNVPPADELKRPAMWDRLLLFASSFVVLVGVLGGVNAFMREKFALLWPDTSGEPWFAATVAISTAALVGYLALMRWDVRVSEHRQAQLELELQERTHRHWNQLYGLIDVSRMVAHLTDLESIFNGISEACVESFDADAVSLMLFEEDLDALVVRSAAGPLSNPEILGRRGQLGEGLAGWAARRREPVLLGCDADVSRYPGIELRDKSIAASMVVPIIVRDELVGVINVSSHKSCVKYDHEDLRTLEVFAENAGSCIRHVEQVSWLRTMVEQLRATAATKRASEEQPIT